jgi:hypothetical protein
LLEVSVSRSASLRGGQFPRGLPQGASAGDGLPSRTPSYETASAGGPGNRRGSRAFGQSGQLERAIDVNDIVRVKTMMTRDPNLHRAPLGYGNGEWKFAMALCCAAERGRFSRACLVDPDSLSQL